MQEVISVDADQAKLVLVSIDKLLRWAKDASAKYEMGMMRLASLLMEAHRGAYWMFRGYDSEEEYIRETFPQSRSNYYTLISIAEHLLPLFPQKQLEDLGRSKCEDLVRIKKHCGLVPANWSIHAAEDDKETFRRRVRAFLNDDGQEDGKVARIDPRIEDHFISIRFFGDQIITFRRGIDVIGQIIGSEKSIGHRVELAFAYFLSGINEDEVGHISGQNGLLMTIIQGCIEQLDFNQPKCSDRLIGTVAAAIQKNSGTKIQSQTDEAAAR
jgi:hypothetical protein